MPAVNRPPTLTLLTSAWIILEIEHQMRMSMIAGWTGPWQDRPADVTVDNLESVFSPWLST